MSGMPNCEVQCGEQQELKVDTETHIVQPSCSTKRGTLDEPLREGQRIMFLEWRWKEWRKKRSQEGAKKLKLLKTTDRQVKD